MKKHSRTALLPLLTSGLLTIGLFSKSSFGEPSGNSTVYKIYGKPVTMEQVEKADPATFYELEKKKYDHIEAAAKDEYLKTFFEKQGALKGLSADKYREEYYNKNIKISETEINQTLEKFKDHPRLKTLAKEEQIKQVREFLSDRDKGQLLQTIIEQGKKTGDLAITAKEPNEPIYPIALSQHDIAKFGVDLPDNQPVSCKGDDCPITIIEFSEFQCPFCEKVLPDAKKVMEAYKGQIRWVMKDFPLSFHDRAKPAAIAARCAGEQKKFWKMYDQLFANQAQLTDENFKKHAKTIGLDEKAFEACVKNPQKIEAQINESMNEGMKNGVSGTPAFFINGRRLSGALPFSEFKKIIDEELAKSNKKS